MTVGIGAPNPFQLQLAQQVQSGVPPALARPGLFNFAPPPSPTPVFDARQANIQNNIASQNQFLREGGSIFNQANGGFGLNQPASTGLFDNINFRDVAGGLNAAANIGQTFLGFQQIGIARDQLEFQRNAFQQQFDIQREEFEYQRQRRADARERYEQFQANLSRQVQSS